MPTPKPDTPKPDEPEVTTPVEEAAPAVSGLTEDDASMLLARIAELEAAAEAAQPAAPAAPAPKVAGEFPTGDSWGVGAEYQFPEDARVFRHTEHGWVQAR